MLVGVTDTSGSEHKFMKYLDWLKHVRADVDCRVLSYKLDNLSVVDSCEAIVLTGGHDVDPALYGGPSGHPTIVDVDRRRDEFERRIVDRALRRKLPFLGICRGLQLVNVHLGGTLIPDIEAAGYPSHRSQKDAERRHDLVVEPQSTLSSITGGTSGNVNSSHHQAAGDPGTGLKISARAADGVIEALEYDSSGHDPFFLLVQWHPERMSDPDNPFCKNILTSFLASVHVAR